jgi:hypothetical protein
MMSEELQLEQGQGPPEVIIKLALQFLTWKELLSVDKPLLNTVALVCKRWNELLQTDEVARPICLNLLKSYDDLVAIRNKNERARAEEQGRDDYEVEVHFDEKHELLAKLMKSGPPPGRSWKDVFMVSKRIGDCMSIHSYCGPDVQRPYYRDPRSLREASIQDFRWIVRPTIERLRGVFDNHDDNGERLKDVVEMRDRLLKHARGGGRTLPLRKDPLRMEKAELAEDAGRTMLMLAASNELDKQMFVPASVLPSVSLADVIGALQTVKGAEIEAQMSLQLKKTPSGMKRRFISLPSKKKLLGMRIDEVNWPVNPVDSINFLIRQVFPQKDRLSDEMDDYYDATEEEKEQKWDDVINNFWLGAGEKFRQLVVAVYNEDVAIRFTDADPISEDTPTREVPLDTLKLIFDLRYSRDKVADRIWQDIEPSLCEQIFEIYHQQAEMLCEAIQEEYHSVYSETSSHEHNAKALLDIFLEVPPRHDDDSSIDSLRFPGSLTPEACDTFPERIEEAMDRWNELIDLIKKNEDMLWGPQTIDELETFEPMFGQSCRGERRYTLEFCFHSMVTEFLYRKLSYAQKVPRSWNFEDDVKKFCDDYVGPNSVMSLPYSERVECENRATRLVQDFRALTTYIYTRHHAMIALVPLLPHLSRHDCKRLVYVLFIQREVDDNIMRSRWECSRSSFSKRHFDDLDIHFLQKMPCAQGDNCDLSRILNWQRENEYDKSHEVLTYLLGLPLPENIISAMGEFMVENLYQGNINDVNQSKKDNVSRVTYFLSRFCYERPKSAHIVWDYMREAIQNAIAVVEDLPENEIEPVQQSIWGKVIGLLVATCIGIRAKRLLSLLSRLYRGTPSALLPENFLRFRTLAERIKQQPLVLNDTLYYHSHSLYIHGGL